MKEETKERLIKVGKTAGTVIIGAALATLVFFIFNLVKGKDGCDSGGGESSEGGE
jgi:hypothetical protein